MKEKRINVSIIMPVYNSEKYLGHAVDSILAQDFDGFELILVDDGSTDGSGRICDEYAERFDKVVVLHKENGGICSARNAGLNAAKGEYIGFSDNDDEFLPHLLRDNYEAARQYNVDLVRFGRVKKNIREDGRVFLEQRPEFEGLLFRDEFAGEFVNVRQAVTVWTGLYRRSVLEEHHIRFDERYKHGLEDVQFNIQFLACCESIKLQRDAYYVWCQRVSHSTSKKFHRNYIDSAMHNLKLEMQYLQSFFEQAGTADAVQYLTDKYVFNLCDYLVNTDCPLSMRDKKKVLAKVSSSEVFGFYRPRQVKKELWNRSKKVYVIAGLFSAHRYGELLHLVQLWNHIAAMARFKK